MAVTGASGYVGSALIEHLEREPKVARILGFDVKPGRVRGKLIQDVVDIRDPAIGHRLEGVDVLVHLAFIMDPIRDEEEMRSVNVGGTQNLLEAAAGAGVRKIIYTSSSVVYGAHPDNQIPLTEESPLRSNLDFSYPAHKLEVEYMIREFRETNPEICFTLLRPAIVFGPQADSAWSHFLELPFVFSIEGYNPPLQFVHEDDVARALSFAVDKDLEGDYNLAPDEWTPIRDLLQLTGRRSLELTEARAFSLMDRMWERGLSEAPSGMLHYVMYPWVMSPAKLQAAGFSCTRSGVEAFLETADVAATRLRVGANRVERATLKQGALAGLGLTALLLWRRRRPAA